MNTKLMISQSRNLIQQYTLLLGSKSPRRIDLMKMLEFNFKVVSIETEENYPNNLQGANIAMYLCEKKANAYNIALQKNDILITADTIVWLEGKCIGKPKNSNDAIEMLSNLSGKTHTVFTGVCLKSANKQHTFSAQTEVHFTTLSLSDIQYYVETFNPFDKAGSYGIQDWIGLIGINGINGCFYNVMGFPVQKFYEELIQFINQQNNQLSKQQ